MRCLNCRQDGISLDAQICPKCGVHLPTLMRDMLPPGTLLQGGNYRVDFALGQGGFGITYRAFDFTLDRPVAIKEFYPQDYVQRDSTSGGLTVPADSVEPYQRWLPRFEREGKILARLIHPGIVKVHYSFKERETAYLVMELLQGGTLADELKAQPEQRLSQERVIQVMSALVEALGMLHQEGVYHLDLKPDNVMITKAGRIVLVDFGSARQDISSMTSVRSRKSTSAFTMEYAPPELIGGKPVSAASDLFELGMILHELLTGQRPDSAWNRFMQDSWIPTGLTEPWLGMVNSALQLRPEDRPQNVVEWWQAYSGNVVGIERQYAEPEAVQKAEQVTRQREQEEILHREAAAHLRREAEQWVREQGQQAATELQRQALEAKRLRRELKARRDGVSASLVTPPTPKPAGQLNRRVFLLGGLGVTGLGGAWLLSQLGSPTSTPTPVASSTPFPESVAVPLAPAPFSSPSTFRFDVLMANKTGEIIKGEQKQTRYFTEDLGNGITLEMVEIPAGGFTMGSPARESERGSDESPQYRVMIPSF
jgi:serine/threonine protein kinase